MVTMTYSDAVVRLSHHLTPEFLTELYQYARTVLPEEEIVKRFLVLSPDLLKPGSEQADTSNMSVEEQQPPSVQDVQDSSTSASTPSQPTQSTSAASDDGSVNKTNQNCFFTKTTPYPNRKKS